MTATYAPALTTDKDLVRFLIADSTPATALFQDEEIAAVLAQETAGGATSPACAYFAAARLLDILQSRWAAAGVSKGLLSKTVGRLSLSWGIPGTSVQVLSTRSAQLRKDGASFLTPQSKIFKLL